MAERISRNTKFAKEIAQVKANEERRLQLKKQDDFEQYITSSFSELNKIDGFYYQEVKRELDKEVQSGRFVFENDNYNEFVSPELIEKVDSYINLLTKAVQKNNDDNKSTFFDDPSSDIHISKFKNIINELNKNSIETSNKHKELDIVKNGSKNIAKQSVTNKEKEEYFKFAEGKSYTGKTSGLRYDAQKENYAKVARMENVKDKYKVNKKWFLIAIGFAFLLMVVGIILFIFL